MNYLIFFCLMIGIYIVPDVIEMIHSTFSRDFYIVHAHLHFYKNFRSEIHINERSLTNSIKRRYLEISSEQTDSTAISLKTRYETNNELKSTPRYQTQLTFLDQHINKISKAYLYSQEQSFRMLTAVNDHSRLHQSTSISLLQLREPRIYGDFSNLNYNVDSVWETCFSSKLKGVIDHISFDSENHQLAVAFSNVTKANNINTIRYYPHFECVSEDETSQAEYETKQNRTKGKSPWYQDILLPVNYAKVMSMDMSFNFMIYTLMEDNEFLHMTYKNEKGEWEHSSFTYPQSYSGFSVVQVLGVKIIQNSEYDEKQVVIVEIVGNEKELFVTGSVYKIQDRQSEKPRPKEFQSTREYEQSHEDDSEGFSSADDKPNSNKRFTFYQKVSLFTVNATDELKSIDAFDKSPFPASKFVFNEKKHQLMILSLDKSLVMIQFLNNTNSFRMVEMESIEDEVDYIEKMVAFEDSTYYGFLAHYKSTMKIFIMHIDYTNEERTNNLYITKLDTNLPKTEKVKDFRIERDADDELMLIVLYEGGEIAGLVLEFANLSIESSIAFILKEGLELVFTVILFSIITLIISCIRRAPSIRINFNGFD